ncbi:hypothetical protein [Negadavirga shengliensis]|uniref:Uncharacterized protein n=1 Tax=Negadavirga shengliensis TaxID=1389218 RepID=A0ABV9T150_9BACT
MSEELKRKSEELEQTLQMQLGQLKKDSEIYVKVAGVALLTGLVSVGMFRLLSPRKPKASRDEFLERRGCRGKKGKKRRKKRYSFFGNLRKRLLWTLLDYGKDKLLEKLIAKSQATGGKER